jgi:hypothetical protein
MQGAAITIILPNTTLTEKQKDEIVARLEKVVRGEAVAAVSNVKDPSTCISAGPVSHCW